MTLSIFRRVITKQLVYVCIGLWKNLQEGHPENDEEVAQGSLSLLKVLMKNGIPKVFNQETAEMELSRSNNLYSREKLSQV